VRPGDVVKLAVTVTAPGRPGTYRLRVGPVQEGVQWFSGADALEVAVR